MHDPYQTPTCVVKGLRDNCKLHGLLLILAQLDISACKSAPKQTQWLTPSIVFFNEADQKQMETAGHE